MPKEIIKQCEDKMMKTVESLKKEFTKIRTGKANPSVLMVLWLNTMVHQCLLTK